MNVVGDAMRTETVLFASTPALSGILPNFTRNGGTMKKVTVLYNHPEDPEAFESYYRDTHLPLAATMKGVERLELTKFETGPDGGAPAFYRMAELYFASDEQLQATLGSPEGQATVADLEKFATGGVTVVIGSVG